MTLSQQPDEPEEPGEIADDEPAADESKVLVPTKLHISGVDTMHTSDIKAYAKSHFGDVERVEWINDTSANLVLASEHSARDAMTALSAVPVADPTALAIGEALPAKPVEGKPEITLQVRFAVASDKKSVGAASRSRYYLLHPEHDPEERRRRNQENRTRYRDRDGDRRRDGGRRRRNSDEQVETFEASMYDDAPQPSRRRRDSDSEDRPRSYQRENRGKELFSERRSGRNRSASPMRDRDGDDLMASSSGNKFRAQSIKRRISADNNDKELFPTKKPLGRGGRLDELEDAIGSAHLREEDRPKIVAAPDVSSRGNSFNIRGIANQQSGSEGFSIKGAAGADARELFPSKLGGSNVGKELFDTGRSKRRQKAEDLFL